MALDKSLIGVVGASAALFVIFCVLAAIVGCFCLRRATKRRQQRLLEKTVEERRERETHYHEGSHYIADTINSRNTLSNGGSVARSDVMPQKMALYRPKILEDSMISKGYRRDSHGEPAARDNKSVSTILVNDPKQLIPEDDHTNLNYNQSNGFILKGYLRSSGNEQGVAGGSARGHVAYGYPVAYYGMRGPEHQHGQLPKGRQVIKQTVEMGHDGKLVVAKSERQFVDLALASAASEPMASYDQGTVERREEARSPLVKPVDQTQPARLGLMGAAQVCRASAEQDTEEASRNDGQRNALEAAETGLTRSSSELEGSSQVSQGQSRVGVEANMAPVIPSGNSTHPNPIDESTDTGSHIHGRHVASETQSQPVSQTSSRPDNYKVIRREHSGHSKMPEWNKEVHSVTECSLEQKDISTCGFNSQITDSLHSSSHLQQHSPGERARSHRATRNTTAQFYHQFADLNSNSQSVSTQGHTKYFTPISIAADSTVLQTILHRPKTKRSTDRKPAVTFQDDVEIVASGERMVRMNDDEDGEIDPSVDSEDEPDSFRPVCHQAPRVRNSTPRLPRNHKAFMDTLPKSEIF